MLLQVDRGLTSALPVTVIFASLLAASPAWADNTEGFDKNPDDLIASDKQAKAEKDEKKPGDKDKAAPADASGAKLDPTEDPGKRYYFIGARFRDIIVPKFMIDIFGDGGATVNVASGGVEFSTRKDRFMFIFGLQYADYSTKPFMLKGNKDPDIAYEIVSGSLKQILFTVDLLYEVPLDKKSRYAFLIGGGVGIGGVFGKLYRSQAFPYPVGTSPDPGDVTKWRGCVAASSPGGSAFCDTDNDHFTDSRNGGKGYDEPSWANGGSKPFLFPWFALPQIGFRWKPIKPFEARFDFGFSISGFFLGLAASYGL